jgi:hypothetical protein
MRSLVKMPMAGKNQGAWVANAKAILKSFIAVASMIALTGEEPNVTGVQGTDPKPWASLRLGAGGFLTGFSIADDNTIVVRTDTYGAYIWNPSAATPVGNAGGTGAWQQLVTSTRMPPAFSSGAQLFASGVYEIQIAPNNSSVLYMMYRTFSNAYPQKMGIYKSTDSGATWAQTSFTPISSSNGVDDTSTDPYRAWGPKIAVHPTDPNTVLVGTPSNGLFYTTDGGTIWNTVATVPKSGADGNRRNPGITGILFQTGLPSTIYAASYGNGIYRTTNGVGGTWSKINSGSGPTAVRLAAISSNGTYLVLDSNQNIWTYASGIWTQTLADGLTTGIAVDPRRPARVLVIQDKGQINESSNSGATWAGWSHSPPPTVTASDIPWLGVFYANAAGLFFDRSVSNKLYVNGNRSFSTTTLSGSVRPRTSVTWTDRSVGIEQLVCNDVIAPPGGVPIGITWDSPVFYRGGNLQTFPASFGPVYDANVVAGWAIDYAQSNPSFLVLVADGSYGGGPQRHSTSTDGGATWSLYDAPIRTFNGDVAVSTPRSWIIASRSQQAYITKNGGVSFSPINLESNGIANPYTISSGTYNSGTGLVTLSLSTAATFGVGANFNITNLRGTGASVGNLSGNFTAAGVSGTTVTYRAATGLTVSSITGGNLSGWGDFGPNPFSHGAHFMASDRVNSNQFTIWFSGVGFFTTTNGGTTWTKYIDTGTWGDNPQLRAVPGQANHLFRSSGHAGNAGNQPDPSRPLKYSTNAGQVWNTVSNMPMTYSVGFGAAAPGQSYPAIYAVGWQSTTSSTRITAAIGSISFTIPSGLGIQVNTPVKIDDGEGHLIVGRIMAYNNSTGAALLDSFHTAGRGAASKWTVYLYGIWRCITGPAEKMIWAELDSWPLGSTDNINSINGDPNIFGRVYIAFAGSGSVYGTFD